MLCVRYGYINVVIFGILVWYKTCFYLDVEQTIKSEFLFFLCSVFDVNEMLNPISTLANDRVIVRNQGNNLENFDVFSIFINFNPE